jgi:hypothetical protein
LTKNADAASTASSAADAPSTAATGQASSSPKADVGKSAVAELAGWRGEAGACVSHVWLAPAILLNNSPTFFGVFGSGLLHIVMVKKGRHN